LGGELVARFLMCGGCTSLAFVPVRRRVGGGGKRQCGARRVGKKRDANVCRQRVAWVG